MELWVEPEIRRRQARGEAPSPFPLRAAQVVKNIREREAPTDAGISVRLNDEVCAVLHATALRAFNKGDPVFWDDLGDIEDLELTNHDPNAGHITVLWHQGKCFLSFDFRYNAFDFRYNAQRIADALDAAREFLDSATADLEAARLRPFVDSLYSATELLAKGKLLMTPDEKLLSSRRHEYLHQRFHRWGHMGNAKREHVKLLAGLWDMRSAARYLASSLDLSCADGAVMLAVAEDMYASLKAEAPVRARLG